MHALELLEWQNLFFVAMIVLSVLLGLLSMMFGGHGGHGHGHGIGHGGGSHGIGHGGHAGHGGHSGHAHGGHGHDAGHPQQQSFFDRVLGILGLGKAPAAIVMTCWFITFGVTGLIANIIAKGMVVLPASVYFCWSVGIAFVCGFIFTGWFAGIVARIMPAEETQTFSPENLIGKTGTAVYSIDKTFGRVHVYDHNTNLQIIDARSDQEITSGNEVVIESYVADGNYYMVSTADLSPVSNI